MATYAYKIKCQHVWNQQQKNSPWQFSHMKKGFFWEVSATQRQVLWIIWFMLNTVFPWQKHFSSGELPYHSNASCKSLSFTNAKPCALSVLVGLWEKGHPSHMLPKKTWGRRRMGFVWWTSFIFTKGTNSRNKLVERNSICLGFVFSFRCVCCVGTFHWSIHHTFLCGPWYPIFL